MELTNPLLDGRHDVRFTFLMTCPFDNCNYKSSFYKLLDKFDFNNSSEIAKKIFMQTFQVKGGIAPEIVIDFLYI